MSRCLLLSATACLQIKVQLELMTTDLLSRVIALEKQEAESRARIIALEGQLKEQSQVRRGVQALLGRGGGAQVARCVGV